MTSEKKTIGDLINEGKITLGTVVGSLPMTRDHAIVIPHISVVYHPEHPGRSMDVDVENERVVAEIAVRRDDGSFEWHTYDIGDCYSTPEAAEKARSSPCPPATSATPPASS